jgi:hypothetical protein
LVSTLVHVDGSFVGRLRDAWAALPGAFAFAG